MVQAIVGHEPEGMGETRTYAKGGYKAEALLRLVSRINYEGISLPGPAQTWETLHRD